MMPHLKKMMPHLVAVVLFYIVSIFTFLPQFQGKAVRMGDIVSWKGMSHEVLEHEEQTGERSLWTNAMFGGMPTYQITGKQSNNAYRYAQRLLTGGLSRPAGYFFFGMIGFYILVLALGAGPWLGMIGALTFSLTTNHLILFEAGHTSKIVSIMTSTLVIAGTIMAYRKHRWLGGALFLLGMGLNLLANHYQMTYYLAMVLGIFVIAEGVLAARDKTLPAFLKTSGLLLAASVLAIGASASKIWTTYEYAADTMRGKPILEQSSGGITSSSETDGLEWEYAMSWSNGVPDVIATFVPGFAGGASSEPISSQSATAKTYRQFGIRADQAPLYWGPMPGTSGPVYLGAVVWLLFILGCLLVRGRLKWWLLTATILTILLSMGKHFPLNRFLFDTLPMYNKFRSPSSTLSITAMLLPIMGVLGLWTLFKSTKDQIKSNLRALYIAGGSMATLALLFTIAGPSMFSLESAADLRYEQQGFDTAAFVKDRASLMRSDGWRSLLFVLIASLGIWAHIKGFLKSYFLIAGLGVLLLLDALPIGKRYFNGDDFVSQRILDRDFQARPVDQQILADTDPYFRVLDLSINTFNSSQSSYFHKTIGGYHPAKLQRYQDLIDRHISQGNNRVLNMLNTKYIVNAGNDGQPFAQRNPAALGNAWFVNTIRLVPNANAEIDALSEFDPVGEAVVHEEFSDYVNGLQPQKNGFIRLKTYAPNRLTYESNSTSDQLAVFSDIWFGPNKGWQASIDGEDVDHIRVNYALRGLKLPSGNHTVEFVFHPRKYYVGEQISLIASIVGLLCILAIFYREGRARWKQRA